MCFRLSPNNILTTSETLGLEFIIKKTKHKILQEIQGGVILAISSVSTETVL
mgnify:CR=1 FL=1